MRFFAIASVLITLVCLALCAGPALAKVPPEPSNDGTGYLDQSTRIQTVPHWVPGSGQWAKPTFDKVNPGLLSKRNGLESHSMTPIPIPAPKSAALLSKRAGLETHSITPIPLPAPKSAAYSGGFQQKQPKGSAKSTKTFRSYRSVR
jgi:hypothetical protein